MDAAAAALYKEGYAVASITLKTRQAALAAARRFFELPDSIKRKAIAPKRQATRGYSPPNAENYAALGGVANQPNDAVEKLRLGAWLPFGGDASEAQDGVSWPREAKELRDALVAFGEEAAAAAVRLVEACADRGDWAAPATGCRATLTINGYGFANTPKSGTLVAAHTDVGVLTLVTFDTGACGRQTRQRQAAADLDHRCGRRVGDQTRSDPRRRPELRCEGIVLSAIAAASVRDAVDVQPVYAIDAAYRMASYRCALHRCSSRDDGEGSHAAMRALAVHQSTAARWQSHC